MREMELTDAGLARLEELAELYLSGNALPFAESAYRESACNAVPSLVAEVRRLREAKTISLCDIREQLESEQAKTSQPCVICGDTETDTIHLYYSGDPWDGTPPYKVALCREHQRALIEPVQEAIKKMKGERDATNA